MQPGTVSSLLIAAITFAAPAQAQLAVDRRMNDPSPMLGLGPNAPDRMAIHAINVGQGQALLFEFSCGLMLIDTGGQDRAATDWKARFTEYRDRVFVRRPELNRTIAVVYLSHPHPDHTLGVEALITGENYTISNVVVGGHTSGKTIGVQRKLVTYANANRIPQVAINTSMLHPRLGLTSRNIDPLRCNGREPNIRVLWGQNNEPHRWPADDEEDENNHSVAVRVEFGQSSFLVVGDMEEVAQRAMIARYARNPRVLDVDVYVAGHHGSHNGTDAALVSAMTPELAIISAGDPADREVGFSAYQFGHPNRRTIAKLSEPTSGVSERRPMVRVAMGVSGVNRFTGAPPVYAEEDLDRAIFATGWDGDIIVLADKDGSKRVIID